MADEREQHLLRRMAQDKANSERELLEVTFELRTVRAHFDNLLNENQELNNRVQELEAAQADRDDAAQERAESGD